MTSSQFSTRDEIAFHARAFHDCYKTSPTHKDLPKLPFSRSRVRKHFGSWNDMLLYAGLPLNRHPARLVGCSRCGKKFLRQVKELVKTRRPFCSSACNASFYTKGRRHSEATKSKISASLKAHRLI